MAELAIDVLDLNWRLLQGEEKPLTPHAARLLRCNAQRARGDHCYSHGLHGEGSRIVALERTRRGDIELDDEFDPWLGDDWADDPPGFNLDAYQARKTRKELSRAVRANRRQLRLQDLQPLHEKERTELDAIDTEIRHARERTPDIHTRREFLKDYIKFFEEHGSKDPISQAVLLEHRLELLELESLLYAA